MQHNIPFGCIGHVSIKYFTFYTDTELTLKHINHTTRTGLRRRYTSSYGVRLSKLQSQFDKGNYFILYQTWGREIGGKIGGCEKIWGFSFWKCHPWQHVFVIFNAKPFSDMVPPLCLSDGTFSIQATFCSFIQTRKLFSHVHCSLKSFLTLPERGACKNTKVWCSWIGHWMDFSQEQNSCNVHRNLVIL